MKKFLSVFAATALLMTGCGGQGDTGTEKKSEPVELHVSAAASLTDAMKELATVYESENPGVKLTFNFGSSGALEQAIENGGKTDLFFSAAKKQMNMLEEKGELVEGTRKDLLRNKVVLIVPKDGAKNIKAFEDLTGMDIAPVALGELKGVPVIKWN